MTFELSGKTAIVTGASSGIGEHLSRRLIQSDMRVIATARRGDRLDALAERLGSRLHPVVGDITDETTRRSVVDAADGRLDLLVNNAGVGAIGPFADAGADRLRKVMEVNFFAAVELTRLAIPSLVAAEDAVICNMGSVLGHRAVPDKSEYCAAKFALHGWSDAIRPELAAQNVAVVLVSPSTTRSEFFDALVDTDAKAKSSSLGSWSPDRVAAATVRAIRRRRAEVILSWGGKALVYADRLSPPLINAVLRRRSAKE